MFIPLREPGADLLLPEDALSSSVNEGSKRVDSFSTDPSSPLSYSTPVRLLANLELLLGTDPLEMAPYWLSVIGVVLVLRGRMLCWSR